MHITKANVISPSGFAENSQMVHLTNLRSKLLHTNTIHIHE